MSIVRTLPADTAQNLKFPKALETNFMKALKAAGYVFDTSKTLAAVSRFDRKIVSTTRTAFFDGQSAFPLVSNVQGSVKPNSEHDLYYAIRISTGQPEGDILTAPFNPGVNPTVPQVSNGLFNLSVNGVTQLKNVPMTEFIGQANSITQMESGIFFLPVPIWWPGQTSVVCEIQSTAVPAFAYAIQVEFIGLGLVS